MATESLASRLCRPVSQCRSEHTCQLSVSSLSGSELAVLSERVNLLHKCHRKLAAHSYGIDSIPTLAPWTLSRPNPVPTPPPPPAPDVACSLLQWVAGIKGSGEAIWYFPKTRKLAARADKKSAGDISESAGEAEASDAGVVTIYTCSCSPYRWQQRTLAEMDSYVNIMIGILSTVGSESHNLWLGQAAV